MRFPPIVQITFIFYHILAVIGIPANLLTIAVLCLGRCGLTKGVTFYLLAMTTADLLVLIFDVVIYYLLHYYFPLSFVEYTSVCSVNQVLNYSLVDCSVWLTVAFTVDRAVAICYSTLRVQYCTLRTAQLISASLCGLTCLKNIAIYFKYEPVYILNQGSLGCKIKLTYYSHPGWLVFDWLDIAFCPLIPYFLIVILNTLTIQHVLAANKKRKSLLGQRKDGRHDLELQLRKKSIILLLAIAGSFVLLWMPYFIIFLHSRITNTHYMPYTYNDPLLIAEYSADMFRLLSSGTNTCIYALAQSRFREELTNAIKHPLKLMINLLRN